MHRTCRAAAVAGLLGAVSSAAAAQTTPDTAKTVAPDTMARTMRDTIVRVARDTAAPTSIGPLVLPGLFYTPETGIGGGIGALWVKGHRDQITRPSNYAVDLLATRNGQFTLAGNADIWTPRNEWHVTIDGTLSRFPYRFYGIGAFSIDSGETYTPTTRALSITAQRLIASGIYGGLRVAYDDVLMADVAPGSFLSGTDGQNGWKLVTVGVLANADTRDRLYWPSRGTFASLTASAALAQLGSTHAYSRLTLDARHYRRIVGEHLLAMQGWVDLTDGRVPFDRLPQLGGQSIARGYLIGRFRDQQAAAVQVEYRSAPFRVFEDLRRVSFVAFSTLAGTAPDITRFSSDQAHASGGLGLRYAITLPDRLHLRLDYGVGRNSRTFSITVGEAF